MKLQFRHDVPTEETMIFEEIYPKNLQLDFDDKDEMEDDEGESIILVDAETGEFIGETYYIPVDSFEEEETEELQPEQGLEPYFGKQLIYIYSTTILPKYQQKGFGKILKAYAYGYAKAKGYKGCIGHARDGASIKLNTFFGAEVVGKFENWFQTGETYWLYLKWF